MTRNIKNYRLALETIGNIHVGNGEKISPVEHVFDSANQRYGLLDASKWLRLLSEKKLTDEYFSIMESGKSVSNFDWMIKKGLSPWEHDIFQYTLDNIKVRISSSTDTKKLNDVAGLNKTVFGNPYIPGSSIKGMLRTALMSCFIYKSRDKFQLEFNELQGAILSDRINKRSISDIIKKIEIKVFGKIESHPDKRITNQVADLMRGIIISDTDPADIRSISIKQKLDFGTNTKKDPKSLPIWREVIKPGISLQFDTGIDYTLIGSKLIFKSVEDLFVMLHFYRETIIMGFEENFNPPLQDTYKSSKEAPLVYIGGGVGFHTKSIIYAMAPDKETARRLISRYLDESFKSTRRVSGVDTVVSPRTFKLSEEGQSYVPMGLCRLRMVKEYAAID